MPEPYTLGMNKPVLAGADRVIGIASEALQNRSGRCGATAAGPSICSSSLAEIQRASQTIGAYPILMEKQMHISAESLLVILLIGAVAGWLAGLIVQGTGFGLLGDIVIGIVGAFIASWLFPQLGLHLGAGIAAQIIAATLGAVLLLVIVRFVRRRGRW